MYSRNMTNARNVHRENVLQNYVIVVFFIDKNKGPRSYLCTEVPYLAAKKWNRSIINESNSFC